MAVDLQPTGTKPPPKKNTTFSTNHLYMKKLLYSALLAAFALMLSAGIFARNTQSEINRNIAIFTALYKELQLNYIDTVDPTACLLYTSPSPRDRG